MNQEIALEKCRTFIDCQLQAAKEAALTSHTPLERPTVTLSRQTGCGGQKIAEKLAEYLQRNDPEAKCPWTVFEKNLIAKVLEDHHLPPNLAQYMPEDKVSEIDNAVGELLGLHPSLWTLIQHTTDTILRLAQMGNAILVGRAAHVIASRLKNAFHVRLVGSLAKRTDHVIAYHHLTRKAAVAFIQREDRKRQRYLKTYFGKAIDDPLLYHLTVNIDWLSQDEVVRAIGEAVLYRQQQLKSVTLRN
jgi:cytidylate kinase